jgi:hypothetical protein
MTSTTSAEIEQELSALTLELNEARTDAATLERLTSAAGKIARLVRQADALTAKKAKAQEAEAKAEREAAYAPFRRITVAVDDNDTGGTANLLRTGFTIRWQQLTYDHRINQDVWENRERNGFTAVPRDVMRYLIEASPASIPACIMQLAPADPARAIGLYLTGLRRGYMTVATL